MNVVRSVGGRGVATGGVLALVCGVSVLGGAGAAGAATTGSSPATCATGTLPAAVLGSPAVAAGSAEGVYLWHQSGGYQLRVTHPGTGKAVFTGTITVSRQITGLKRVKLERGDYAYLTDHGRSLHFRFTDFGKLDGIAFAAECSKDVHVALRIDGTEASTNQVFLGSGKVDPSAVPFTITRGAATV